MKYWRVPLDVNEVNIPRGDVRIIVDQCKGCGFCEEYCPRDILVMSDKFNRKGYHYPDVVEEGDCVNCCLCEMICPEFAIMCIEVESEESKTDKAHKEAHSS